MEKEFVCHILNELPRIATDLIEEISRPGVVLFRGEMGAGKTTLISEICAAMGVQDVVSSPTFALVNEYQSEKEGPVYHFDFYRIEDESEALDVGVFEYFDSGNWCFVEWPEQIEGLLLEEYPSVNIKTEGSKRIYTLHG